MNKKGLIGAAILAGSFSTAVNAVPVDLSSWSALTLEFTPYASNWALNATNTIATQTENSDPTMLLNNIDQTNYEINGSWKVDTNSDDDYLGFVFGYQNSSNFYLFDWKQSEQTYLGAHVAEGMTIKKMTGATGDGLVDLSFNEFWVNESDFGDMDVLATNHGSTKGWVDYVSYDFYLDFNTTAGQFKIIVKEGLATLWDVTVSDSTFTSGQFGFYNFSQSRAQFSNFDQISGPPPIPAFAPAGLGLFGLGLLAALGLRRKQV